MMCKEEMIKKFLYDEENFFSKNKMAIGILGDSNLYKLNYRLNSINDFKQLFKINSIILPSWYGNIHNFIRHNGSDNRDLFVMLYTNIGLIVINFIIKPKLQHYLKNDNNIYVTYKSCEYIFNSELDLIKLKNKEYFYATSINNNIEIIDIKISNLYLVKKISDYDYDEFDSLLIAAKDIQDVPSLLIDYPGLDNKDDINIVKIGIYDLNPIISGTTIIASFNAG